MSRFISKDAVEELTGRVRAEAQAKVLRELGFTVLWVKGQTPKVSIENFIRVTGGAPVARQKQEVKMDFSHL